MNDSNNAGNNENTNTKAKVSLLSRLGRYGKTAAKVAGYTVGGMAVAGVGYVIYTGLKGAGAEAAAETVADAAGAVADAAAATVSAALRS